MSCPVAERARRRNLIGFAECIEKLAESLDAVAEVIVDEEGRADAFDGADRVEEGRRIEIMLRRAVRLEEVAIAAGSLIEVDLLPVGQHGAAADRRGTVDAR